MRWRDAASVLKLPESSLTATVRSSTLSWARQTIGMPPVPSTSSNRYRPLSTRRLCIRALFPRPVARQTPMYRYFSGAIERQPHDDARAGGRLRQQPDGAAVPVDDRPAEREAEPGTGHAPV